MIKTENGEVHIEGTVPRMCADLAVIISLIKDTAMEDAEDKGHSPEDADVISNRILTQAYFFGIQRGREDHEKKRKGARNEGADHTGD